MERMCLSYNFLLHIARENYVINGRTVMKENLCRNNVWIVAAAFFIGRCNVFEMNPVAVAFLVAVCLQNGNGVLVYGTLLFGMATVFPMRTIVRYAIICAVLLLVFSSRRRILLKREKLLATFLAGVIVSCLNALIYYAIPQMQQDYLMKLMKITGLSFTTNILLEGVVVFSLSYIFRKAIAAIREDYAKVATDSECTIAVMLLAAAVLFGMPEKGPFDIVISEGFALFSVLFSLYVFGGGIGIAWSVLVGFMRAGECVEMSYLFSYVILGMVCAAVLQVLRCGRILLAGIFVCTYFLCGLLGYSILLSIDGKKALLSAVFLFLLLPQTMVLRVEHALFRAGDKNASSAWGKLVLERVNNFAAAMKRIDYTFAGNANVGASFLELGAILEDFAGTVPKEVPINKTMESKIVERLARKNICTHNLSLTKNRDGRFMIYLTLYTKRYKLITVEYIRRAVEQEMGIRLVIAEESRRVVGAEPTLVCLLEAPRFTCKTAVRKLSRYASDVSGDNYYIGEIVPGKMLFMIADGMGNGTQAADDSNTLLEALEELLQAGFEQESAIKIVNSYMAEQNKGERFATLDMLLVDLYTGHGVMCKQGAATTYIRRGEWMELVKSTSLPVGVVHGAALEQCTKKFYHNDMIILVSDGVLESIIFENKEDYMHALLIESKTDNPEELVSYVVNEICGMCGNRLKDDATIVACKLVKTL